MRNRIIFISSIIFAVIILFLIVGSSKKARIASTGQPQTRLSLEKLVAQVKQQEEKSDYEGAKETYKKLISDFFEDARIQEWQKTLEDINIKLILSPSGQPDTSTVYEVKQGDNLVKISKQFNTTVELIKKINNLSSDTIRVGRQLKIWTKPFNVVVDKSQNILILKAEDEMIKTYIVSTGKDNSTPIGGFTIKDKIPNPVWYKQGVAILPEDPENILGTHWMGFDLAGYGIHGTTNPSTIGTQETQGCVRMTNDNVKELFMFLPIGTKVTIID